MDAWYSLVEGESLEHCGQFWSQYEETDGGVFFCYGWITAYSTQQFFLYIYLDFFFFKVKSTPKWKLCGRLQATFSEPKTPLIYPRGPDDFELSPENISFLSLFPPPP